MRNTGSAGQRNFGAPADHADLGRFGYAQELNRSLGGLTSFALAFAVAAGLMGTAAFLGLGAHGPVPLMLAWLLAVPFALALAASLAELSSAYPTSGAMHHWAAGLGGPAASWFAGWLGIVGLALGLAGINYVCARLVLDLAGVLPHAGNVLLAVALVALTQGLLNHLGPWLVAAVAPLAALIPVAGAVPWALAGFHAAAHFAEETRNPRRTASWALFLSVLAAAAWGLAGGFRAPPWAAAAGMGCSGAACMAAASRAVYAMARDGGMPLPGFFRRVSARSGTPGVAIWTVALLSAAPACWGTALPVLVSVALLGLFAAACIPVAFAWRERVRGSTWPTEARWRLGRLGPGLNAAAIACAAGSSLSIALPPNQLAAGVFTALLLLLAFAHSAHAWRKYRGPRWSARAAGAGGSR